MYGGWENELADRDLPRWLRGSVLLHLNAVQCVCSYTEQQRMQLSHAGLLSASRWQEVQTLGRSSLKPPARHVHAHRHSVDQKVDKLIEW